MPILALPGEMTPGQLGPMSARSSSLQLLPDLHHVECRDAFGDADDERDAGVRGFEDGVGCEWRRDEDDGGVRAGLLRPPRLTVLKTGQPSCVVPPLPGVTPPTTLVPYSAQPLAWKVPSLPVMPWTIRRVFLSTRTAI